MQKQLPKANSLETEMSSHRKYTDFVLEEEFIQAWFMLNETSKQKSWNEVLCTNDATCTELE